ncbi:Undecaprenyl-phosphate 4-deoxy-4-formamido-L-arabinose transferase [Planctomycetes bacterium Pan216]|uniref:Undecaprenyl-phosphate 4-deoxy-4-formamido-L-arabinose transferase n=1 Tax=Kolteria novifilia TaxID=2527975 RepID=A0A518BBR4_9BACT|nr:Undecaprenyl-phosphate 4-deoxy-4-formamido-L-arabinose transferase [Planctomycetes bacterium Pan216]
MSREHDEPPLLSFVIPVFNEAESLPELHAQLDEVIVQLPNPSEIIFVDDGSSDESWKVIEELQCHDSRISSLRFRRNFGKAAALTAGFSIARGAFVFTLDADLQDDPGEIPRFLEKMATGFDIVSGWKKVRHDPFHKTIPSRVFNGMVSWMTGVHLHDHNCGFKCYRDEVLDEIKLYGEFHRFAPVLAHAKGFRVGELVVNHRPREHGVSKYGWQRFIKGFLDLLTVKFLTAYQNRPQHLLGTGGLIFSALGLSGLAYLTLIWLITWMGIFDFGPIGRRPLLMFSATTLLLGIQMLSIGLIAELITARSQDEMHVYSVAERRLSPLRLKLYGEQEEGRVRGMTRGNHEG